MRVNLLKSKTGMPETAEQEGVYISRHVRSLMERVSDHYEIGDSLVPDYVLRRTARVEGYIRNLVERAERDYLTNLYNPRTLREKGDLAIEKERRMGRKASLIFIDLDGFKNVNDTLGHHVGDEILRRMAGALRRNSDIVGRYGGDEFVVVLPGTNEQGAIEVDNKIRAAFDEAINDYIGELSPTGQDLSSLRSLSYSAGIGTTGKFMSTMEELETGADEAMFIHKNGKKCDANSD